MLEPSGLQVRCTRRRGREQRVSHGARWAVALTSAVSLLLSCSSTETPDRGGEPAPTRPGDTAAATPTSLPDAVGTRLPKVPSERATALARQLDRAGATLRQPDAAPRDVRRAAEFHQLAARALAGSPAAFRTRVTARLRPATARSTRSDVRAAGFLLAMSSPQPKLPRWRIVAPPPPAKLLGLYRRAQRRTGVPWSHLAAIHLVETRMGRIRGTSTAGALGPMQFLPTTWDLYGAGGDINDPRDAILAAARLLKHHGAPGDMAGALWHYNPSDNYVGAVLAYASSMRRSATAYAGYWHWRVLYTHIRGTHVLPVGYPSNPAVRLPG